MLPWPPAQDPMYDRVESAVNDGRRPCRGRYDEGFGNASARAATAAVNLKRKQGAAKSPAFFAPASPMANVATECRPHLAMEAGCRGP